MKEAQEKYLQMTQLVGQVYCLAMDSHIHKHWTLEDFQRMVMPPLLLDQSFIFYTEKIVTGFFTWANLTEEAERAFVAREGMQPEDWNAGDGTRIWIVDALAPAGAMKEMVREIRKMAPKMAEDRGWSPDQSVSWSRTYRYGEVDHIGRGHR